MIEENGLVLRDSLGLVSYPGIFRNWGEYKGLKTSLIIFLRLCLAFREAYFLWVERKRDFPAASPDFAHRYRGE